MRKQTKLFGLIAILMTSLALGACAGTGQTTGEYVDDSVITAKVKTKLIEDPTTKARSINVVTQDGKVYLTGLVDTDAEKDRAEELAKQVSGVKSVTNELATK